MSVENSLIKIMSKKGYKNILVSKKSGAWNVAAFNPLQKEQISHVSIGRNFETAKSFLEKTSEIPEFYVCTFFADCEKCGASDQPIGFTIKGGAFIHKCRSCDFEWVAVTEEDNRENLEAIMEEALTPLC